MSYYTLFDHPMLYDKVVVEHENRAWILAQIPVWALACPGEEASVDQLLKEAEQICKEEGNEDPTDEEMEAKLWSWISALIFTDPDAEEWDYDPNAEE